jgi:molecular chaperone DnaK (HSP70)
MEENTTINMKATSFVEILSHYFKNLKNTIDNQADFSTENVVLGRPVHFRDDNDGADIGLYLMQM